jgi:hypothetical protein
MSNAIFSWRFRRKFRMYFIRTHMSTTHPIHILSQQQVKNINHLRYVIHSPLMFHFTVTRIFRKKKYRSSIWTSYKEAAIMEQNKLKLNSSDIFQCNVPHLRSVITKSGNKKKQLNSVALLRKRTIPTERPSPVGENPVINSWNKTFRRTNWNYIPIIRSCKENIRCGIIQSIFGNRSGGCFSGFEKICILNESKWWANTEAGPKVWDVQVAGGTFLSGSTEWCAKYKLCHVVIFL